MTVKDFFSVLVPAEGTNVKLVKDGEVLTKFYAAYYSSLSLDILSATIASLQITNTTNIVVTLANE